MGGWRRRAAILQPLVRTVGFVHRCSAVGQKDRQDMRRTLTLLAVLFLVGGCTGDGGSADEPNATAAASATTEVTSTTAASTTTTAALVPESDEGLAVEFSHSQEHGVQPFVATGAAVDGAAMCAAGTHEIERLESIEGGEITDEDWADMFDSAMDAGTVAEMVVFEDWICDDGSGAFTLELHNQFDFATFEFEGQQDVGTWEINEGTDSYADVTGSGNITLNLDAANVTYSGEIQP